VNSEQDRKQEGATIREGRISLLALRSLIGGMLMGLANLVPGISGGTMLLASGVYPRFINAIAEVTTLRFKLRSLVVLGCVVAASGLAILLLAGTVKDLVVDYRWVMYSIFIGLTFGGIPIVWKMLRPARASSWIGAVCGFVVMAIVALLQQSKYGADGGGSGSVVMMFVAGVAGAGAMILPGISGGYLLLVLGQYVPILSAVDTLKEALKAQAFAEVMQIGLTVVLPVGIGVVVGVVVISNLLRIFLRRCEKATLGVLLGLLLGAVVGLWPFQEGVKPEIGDTIKGQVLTEETLAELEAEDYPTAFFRPDGKQIGGALGLIVAGFACTCLIARIGGGNESGS
jgi:putative membrane protein